MMARGLREELDMLRAELARRRDGQGGAAERAERGAGDGAQSHDQSHDQSFSQAQSQARELALLVREMLEEAEETVAAHPVATVAGALALGILIGRLTAQH